MRLTEFLLTGGEQRVAAVWLKEFHHYKRALLASIDFRTLRAERLYSHVTEPDFCAGKMPSIVFKAATREGGRLYLTTETEVLVLSYPELALLHHVSHPTFNDVHHVMPWNGGMMVAATGLDLVIVFDQEFRATEFLSVLDDNAWARFSPTVDYRKIPSTKPHAAHPNFLFRIGDEAWVTRLIQKDAVAVRDHSRRIDIAVGYPHDGIVVGDYVYFTTVNGYIVVAHIRTWKVEAIIDLTAITGRDIPLGWCRGLCVDGNVAYVGFSRIRWTNLYKNLRWLKRRFAGSGPPESLPTHVAAYDLERRVRIGEVNVATAGMDAIFSILPQR